LRTCRHIGAGIIQLLARWFFVFFSLGCRGVPLGGIEAVADTMVGTES
jgi:hypothetical protein